MRFRGLDLNALVALNVLFEERSVTAAAKRLFLSQSAMSGILAKLRDHFADPLLETVGRKLILTPFGQSIVAPLQETMRHIEMIAGASTRFEAATSQRVFSVVASDYLIGLIVPKVLPAIIREAPSVKLVFSHPSDAPQTLLNQGDVDLVITPEGFIASPHLAELFYEEDHVVLGWDSNPAMSGPIDANTLTSSAHVVVRFGRGGQESFAERELSRIGCQPTVTVVAASFTSVPAMLVGTSLISVVHRRLAAPACATFPLRIHEMPIALPKMRQTMLYHPLRRHDVGLSWLRDHLRAGIDR